MMIITSYELERAYKVGLLVWMMDGYRIGIEVDATRLLHTC
jgi:hypothetical protein